MTLTDGSRLAHYDVTALIGEGGMGDFTGGRLTRESVLGGRRARKGI